MSESENAQWPRLSRLRQQAKALLKSIRSGDSSAIERFRQSNHPDFKEFFENPDSVSLEEILQKIRLNHVQWMIAHERGLRSWPNLKAYCETLEMAHADRVHQFLQCAIRDNRHPGKALPGKARWMLEADPGLRSVDLCTALVTGETEPALKRLRSHPEWVREKIGPKNWEPILYLAYSVFLNSESFAESPQPDRFTQLLSALLKAGADPNAWYELNGDPNARQTALYGVAGLARRPDLTRILLEAGADPNDAAPGLGPESLYHAAESDDLRCLEALLEAGPDLEKVSYCMLRKLDFEDPEGVQLFLKHGADPNFTPPHFHGAAALMSALRNGRSDKILKILIEGGADPMLADHSGMTPLRLAVRYGRRRFIQWLAELANIPQETFEDEDRFWGAVFSGNQSESEQWFNQAQMDPNHLRPESVPMFSRAAFLGNHKAVRILLDLGFPLTFTDREQMTPLHWAVWNADRTLTQWMLKTPNPPLEQRSAYDGTVLGTAVYAAIHGPGNQKDYPTIIRWLLESGAIAPGRCAYPTPNSEINAILRPFCEPSSQPSKLHPHVERMQQVACEVQDQISSRSEKPSPPISIADWLNQWSETLIRAVREVEDWPRILWSNSSLRREDAFQGLTIEEALKKASELDLRNLMAQYFGWQSWSTAEQDPKFTQSIQKPFESAVDALVAGDVEKLSGFMDRHPELIDQTAPWGHRCQLIHYIAANGVEIHRQLTPPNVVEIARVLLEAGADPDALANTYGGGPNQTPLCLVLTSAHPGERKIRTALVQTLIEYGAAPNGIDHNNAPLQFALQYGETASAEILYQAGARPWNLWSAAGIGDLVELDNQKKDTQNLAEALYFAGRHGRLEAVSYLLDHGADMYFEGFFGGTAAHWACIEGHEAVVKMLIQRGMNPDLRDPTFDSNLAGWAEEGGHLALRDWILKKIKS